MSIASSIGSVLGSLTTAVVKEGLSITVRYAGKKAGRVVLRETASRMDDTEENRQRLEIAEEMMESSIGSISLSGPDATGAAQTAIEQGEITRKSLRFETQQLARRLRSGQERISG